MTTIEFYKRQAELAEELAEEFTKHCDSYPQTPSMQGMRVSVSIWRAMWEMADEILANRDREATQQQKGRELAQGSQKDDKSTEPKAGEWWITNAKGKEEAFYISRRERRFSTWGYYWKEEDHWINENTIVRRLEPREIPETGIPISESNEALELARMIVDISENNHDIIHPTSILMQKAQTIIKAGETGNWQGKFGSSDNLAKKTALDEVREMATSLHHKKSNYADVGFIFLKLCDYLEKERA